MMEMNYKGTVMHINAPTHKGAYLRWTRMLLKLTPYSQNTKIFSLLSK